MYLRNATKSVKVGSIFIGGGNRVSVQSMCNTYTADIESTVQQITQLKNAGCEIVRLAIPDIESAQAIKSIKKNLLIPIVADIHFSVKLALTAIDAGADKIRINPGNLPKRDLVELCAALKGNGIPVRIGVNSGSLDKLLLTKYKGPTADALVESALQEVACFEKLGFDDIVVSIKASNVLTTVEACKNFADHSYYPQHIGITESGTMESGVIKSSVGLGIILYAGIGDTVRMSLTADPVCEVEAAYKILYALKLREAPYEVISCPTCARCNVDIIGLASEVEAKAKAMHIIPKGRLKLAVMGCVVNGPGEAKEADYALAGGNDGRIVVFRQGTKVNIVNQSSAVEELFRIIFEDLNIKEC